MTMALCFNCGDTKFGAICPCPKCQVRSTGQMELDIAFSDHHLSLKTLEAFGEVIRAIHKVCADDQLCFWTFIYYVSQHHRSMLGVELEAPLINICPEVLERANPPVVTVELSSRGAMLGEMMKEVLDKNPSQTQKPPPEPRPRRRVTRTPPQETEPEAPQVDKRTKAVIKLLIFIVFLIILFAWISSTRSQMPPIHPPNG